MPAKKVKLVICWHMHQPWYRESIDGQFHLPWVYLHALKDYADMASHLEANPNMQCVVNFTPVLLEQIEDYGVQCKNWLKTGEAFSDPLLNYLAGITPIPKDTEAREELIRICLRANASQMIHPYENFTRLLETARIENDQSVIDPKQLAYLNDQFFYDLLTWYHIVWLGYSVKQLPIIQGMINKGEFFTAEDRTQLIQVFEQVMNKLIERYRQLADKDQVELAMTPYAHPIMPLLIDFKSMHDALPEAVAPMSHNYPGGYDRAVWHMEYGIEVFERFFKRRPQGIWLSEGAVSEQAVKLLDRFDIKWTASGEGVWHNSSYLSDLDVNDPETRQNLFSCNRLEKANACLFFRDDGLSDLIGFEYQSWNPDDAVADFVNHVHNIAKFLQHSDDEHVVSVILDGENAWEYYPDNGFHFLNKLFKALSESKEVETCTFAHASDSCCSVSLPKLCAGSWVYGSFSTWIGEQDKNHGWDLLVAAKQAYDKNIGHLTPDEKQHAQLQLAVCEGSDWFWWFGDYNPSDSVRDFDSLYRLQLQHLYQLLKLEIPDTLFKAISEGGGDAENAGTMRRGHDG